MKVIHSTAAPEPIGCYSQAVQAGGLLFLSGQIGMHPQTQVLSPSIEDQLNQVFENLTAVMKAAGGDLSHIHKLTIYLVNLDDFPKVNQTMSQFFHPPYPARATVGVSKLPKGALVEIEAIASLF